MNVILGFILACVFATSGVRCIDCYRCNSTNHRECLEKLIRPTSLRPESCSDVFEARYCIKTTGFYAGQIGDQRFCSSRDLGNYCEYMQQEGDDREYRSCVYTCDTDRCNAATRMTDSDHLLSTTTAAILVTAAALLQRPFGVL